MSEQTNYLNIPELVDKLKGRTDKLQAGGLKLEELALMTEDARDLYERLVILSYKTGEAEIAAEEAKAAPTPAPPAEAHADVVLKETAPVLDENIHPVKEEAATEATPQEDRTEEVNIKFDLFDAPKVPENQVSLMDVIAEEEQSRSVNESVGGSNKHTSLGNRLGMSPISDLAAAIGINQKFLFMNDLFNGENESFKEAVSKLNSCANIQEAEEYVNGTLAMKYEWNLEGTSASSFLELVERRYL